MFQYPNHLMLKETVNKD